jgi:carboxymethylenebutenolidase
MTITTELLAVEDGHLPLTIARALGAGAAVVLMPSAFGVGFDLQAQMEELAADAAVVVAIDPFFREDGGPAPYEDMKRAVARLRALDVDRARRDLRAAIEWARRQGGGHPVVIVGICFGGPYALEAAADGTVDGVVIWHGTHVERSLGRAAEMRCPLRLHFGDADPFVPKDSIEAVRAAFRGRDDVSVVVHRGATHGFTHRAASQAYDERAERTAMDAVRELVIRVGGREPAERAGNVGACVRTRPLVARADVPVFRLVPLLVVRDAARALDFYAEALGASEVVRFVHKKLGTISHADLAIGGALFSVTEEARAWNCDAPPTLGGSPVVLQLFVDDVDEFLDRVSSSKM